jgi:hypothetical protein
MAIDDLVPRRRLLGCGRPNQQQQEKGKT